MIPGGAIEKRMNSHCSLASCDWKWKSELVWMGVGLWGSAKRGWDSFGMTACVSLCDQPRLMALIRRWRVLISCAFPHVAPFGDGPIRGDIAPGSNSVLQPILLPPFAPLFRVASRWRRRRRPPKFWWKPSRMIHSPPLFFHDVHPHAIHIPISDTDSQLPSSTLFSRSTPPPARRYSSLERHQSWW